MVVQPDKWTVIALNALSYFNENKCFASGTSNKFFMRSFKLQSQMMVKGVYTSDMAYSSTTLPKDIQLKVPKDKDWFAEYAWVQLPTNDVPAPAKVKLEEEEPRKARTQTNFAQNEDIMADGVELEAAARTTTKSILKKKPPRAPSADGDSTRVTFPSLSATQEIPKSKEVAPETTVMATTAATVTTKRPSSARPASKKGAKTQKVKTAKPAIEEETKASPNKEAPAPSDMKAEMAKLKAQKEEEQRRRQEMQREQFEAMQNTKRVTLDMTQHEIEQIRENFNFNLESKNLSSNPEVTSYQEAGVYDPSKS